MLIHSDQHPWSVPAPPFPPGQPSTASGISPAPFQTVDTDDIIDMSFSLWLRACGWPWTRLHLSSQSQQVVWYLLRSRAGGVYHQWLLESVLSSLLYLKLLHNTYHLGICHLFELRFCFQCVSPPRMSAP